MKPRLGPVQAAAARGKRRPNIATVNNHLSGRGGVDPEAGPAWRDVSAEDYEEVGAHVREVAEQPPRALPRLLFLPTKTKHSSGSRCNRQRGPSRDGVRHRGCNENSTAYLNAGAFASCGNDSNGPLEPWPKARARAALPPRCCGVSRTTRSRRSPGGAPGPPCPTHVRAEAKE